MRSTSVVSIGYGTQHDAARRDGRGRADADGLSGHHRGRARGRQLRGRHPGRALTPGRNAGEPEMPGWHRGRRTGTRWRGTTTALSGVRQDATSEEIKRAYRKLARELHPDVNPDEGAQERFSEVTAAYEVLSDPQKRKIVDMGGDPLGNGGGGGGRDPFAGFGLGDIMDAFFGGGGGGGRGPRSRVQPGSDALIRIELTLEECNTGVSRELTVDTAVLCDACRGVRRRGGHVAAGVRHVRGPRRDPVGAAVVPRPGRHGPAVPGVPRRRRGHPRPVPAVRRRRPGARAPHHHREGPAGRRRRHAGAAVRPGRGRPRRRPGRRPVRRGRRAAARARSSATAPTCTARCGSR